MKKVILVLFIGILAACSNTVKDVSPTAILISDVHIVDVVSGEILENRQVIIDSGKIKSIQKSTKNASNYLKKIDGTGKFLMPGLAEMHAHIPPSTTDPKRIEETLFLYLSNGITTIRGMLGDPLHLTLRKKAKTGEIMSPRIFTSSPSLNGNSVKTIEEAATKVVAYQQAGYDFLKIHPGIQKDVFDQVVKTANEVGISFAGHVPVDVGIRHALASKYAAIDHVDGFLEGLVPESKNVDPTKNGFFGFAFTPLADVSKINELVSLSKQNEVWIVPTQSLFERWFAPISADELLAQPEMKYMPASTLITWKNRKEEYTAASSGFNKAQWKKFDSIRKTLIYALNQEGHGMLLGSDAPQLFNVPGFSIHHEIKGMLSAGMTSLEILQSGTINPATFFKMPNTFGKVAEGFDADLVLLQANPLENLTALKQVIGVMVGGRWISKTEIDQKLNQIAKNATEN